jgi:hypothetical protein
MTGTELAKHFYVSNTTCTPNAEHAADVAGQAAKDAGLSESEVGIAKATAIGVGAAIQAATIKQKGTLLSGNESALMMRDGRSF